MRILMTSFIVAMMAFIVPFGAAHAQDNATAEDAGDMGARLNLAKIMHELKPASQQIDIAIDMVSRRMPAERRESFVNRMHDIFDYKKLEDLSVKAMAEVFTEVELQKMVDYYGSKEAMSIDNKMPVYQSVMKPQITKMLDEAMLEVRTGGPTDMNESGEGASGSSAAE